jgi:hypothetical protein
MILILTEIVEKGTIRNNLLIYSRQLDGVENTSQYPGCVL